MNLRKCFVVLCIGAAAASAQLPLRENASPVVMTVDGKNITAADVQKILDLGQPDFLRQYQMDPQGALMNWYVMLHLGAEGERQKLDQQSPLKEQFEIFKLNMLASAALNQELNTYPVTTEMAEKYFNEHREKYEQAKIKAIYISFKPSLSTPSGTSVEALQRAAQEALAAGAPGRTEAEAEARAAEVVQQLRGGADFGKVAETYSDDPSSKAKGGDFGAVKASSPYPEDFRRTIMALETGAISDPIRQATGFYIVRVEEKGVPPMEEVRTEINSEIRQEHVREWMQGLNLRFNPVIKDPSLLPGRK